MHIESILKVGCVQYAAPCRSKKRALELVSELAAQHLGCPMPPLFYSLFARERLGSTGLGGGIAIPHGILSEGIPAIAVMLTLEQGVAFEAQDNKPVDILFALFIPENEKKQHLKNLTLIAEKLSDKVFCKQLRQAKDATELYQLLIEA